VRHGHLPEPVGRQERLHIAQHGGSADRGVAHVPDGTHRGASRGVPGRRTRLRRAHLSSPKPWHWFRVAYDRLLRHAGSIPIATGSLLPYPHAATRAAHFDALAGEFVAAAIVAGGVRHVCRPRPLSYSFTHGLFYNCMYNLVN
jgi:hypothetical protein